MKENHQKPGTRAVALLILFFAGAAGPLRSADDPASLLPPDDVPELVPADVAFPPDLALSEEESEADAETLLVAAQTDPAALGALSIGTPDAGLLLNPVPFPDGPYWVVKDRRESWATQETVDYVVAAIESVEARFPGSPRLVIGDISHPAGGRLNRHRSHQAGRDVDIGFYYHRAGVESFLTARKKDLDLPRTWALVRALVTETDVERIFVDRSLIAVLYQHAVSEGEEKAWLDDVFGRAGTKGIIQHERRHRDHLHVRFYNPRAQETGRIVYPVLVETGVAPPPMVKHRVRPGETMGHLARRYGTSVSAIKAANGLRSSFLRAGRSYTIPIRRVPKDDGPIVVPPRRLPPDRQARASSEVRSAPAPEAPSEAGAEPTAPAANR